MSLTENQIQLVTESFAGIAPKGAAFVARFFQRLFNDYPETKPICASNPHVRQKKLLGALVIVVEHLSQPREMHSALQQWGVGQSEYSAVLEHHQAAGRTLLRTLEEFCGDLWGSELQQAWSTAFQVVREQVLVADEQVATALGQ